MKKKKRKKETKNRGKIENKWQDNGFKPIINYHIKCEWSKHHKKDRDYQIWGDRQDPNISCLQRTHIKYKDINRNKK